MKSTGIVRKVDDLGRIVIPIELRKNLEIEIGTPIEIFTEENEIILKKQITKYCECGQALEKTDKFCKKCGKKVN